MIDKNDRVKVREAELMEASLRDYPVLNEDHYSQKQNDAIYRYWENCSIRERVEYCQENRECIFAARRADEIPENVYQRLSDTIL